MSADRSAAHNRLFRATDRLLWERMRSPQGEPSLGVWGELIEAHDALCQAAEWDEPLPTEIDPRLRNYLGEPTFVECFVPRWLREWWANRGR